MHIREWLTIGIFLLLYTPASANHRHIVKVGIPDNPPIAIQKVTKPTGLAVDILDDIAAQNAWDIEYIQAPWQQLLKKLSAGKIDLLAGVAYSDTRALRFDFTHETLVSNWGVIYRDPDVRVRSVLSLRGKRVALVQNTMHANAFAALLKQFDVPLTVVPVKNYIEAFEVVHKGGADVALVSHLFGLLNAMKHNVVKTGINFNPVEIRFASPKGQNGYILATIDQYLSAQIFAKKSTYHYLLKKWLEGPVQEVTPAWMAWLIGGVLVFLCVLWLNVVLLRHKVQIRTRALRDNQYRFKGLFDHAEISIWNEDLSEVYKALGVLRQAGVSDLRQYLENNTQAAWDMVNKVKVIDVNAATLKLFDAQSEAHFFYQLDKTFAPKALSVFIDECCAIWTGQTTFRSEIDLKTIHGKTIHAIISFRIPEAEEGFKNIPVTIFDLTEREAAEEARKESEQKLALALEASNSGYWVYNTRAETVFWSDENSKLLGYEPGEVTASLEAWRNRIHPQDRDEVSAAFLQHFADQSAIDMEYRIELPNGDVRWIHNTGKSIIDQKGRTQVVTGIQSDITDRKHAELKALEAMEAAEKANAVKSEFLASMSHELRTPLNAILGFGQMMQFDPKNPLTPVQKEYIENILLGGNQLLQLVTKLLDLVRIEADQTEIYLEDVDVFGVIEECVELSGPHGERSEVTIINQFSRIPSLTLHTDRMRLKQMLFNLLSNAIKFNRVGGTVYIKGESTDNDFLRLSVTDTGIAIAKKDFPDIFQIFCRHGNTALMAQEGIGIGLHVTKTLAEQMAGRVGFESEKGVGSTFWIELPLSSNEEILIWGENLRVNVDSIDKDHQVLHALINKIARCASNDENISHYIDELADYARYHFRREETVMKACGYKGLRNHRFMHRHLMQRMGILAEVWRKEKDSETLHGFRKFLRDFFVRHVIQVDVGIADLVPGNEDAIQQALVELEAQEMGMGAQIKGRKRVPRPH